MEQMIRKIIKLCLLIIISGFSSQFSATSTWAKTPEVSAIRIGHSGGKTRFVLDINQNIKFNIFTLANPNRVVIDISEVVWKSNFGGAKGKGFIDRYRYGLFKPGTSRIVLDVKGPVRVQKAFMIKPKRNKHYRFVIDLKKTSKQTFVKNIKKPVARPATKRAVVSPKKDLRGLRKKKLIVIDPGHGGHDPGNLGGKGYRGFPEKTVVLSAAKTIQQELEKTGRYRVVMTRSHDVFVKLRNRSRIAHNKQADLFISIHADSFKSPKVRGATVYTLSEKASDKEAAAMAARENKSDIIAGMDLDEEIDIVQSILIDLVKRETMNLSSSFANELIPQLKKAVVLRTRPHRTAGLIVLKGLDVPSVLVELGYLTNRKDAKLMMQKETQKKIGKSIVKAADNFFNKTYVAN
ncbi:N-acetylmuramoyl-L-alanine amidase [hydrothermal vent metagenome]|uniref:N-acetylmuramoyl-L-alanine amidase n=1 Tax=hydrothermal vent metagenome TaxID=652676 RepID=A0A3B0S7G9_9ZZZZ